MSKVSKRTKRIAITTSVMLALGGGAAIAYWSATGTAAGTTAAAGNATAFVVTSTAATGGTLAPGSTASQVIDFTVKNDSTAVMRLTDVNARVANTDGSTWTFTKTGSTAPACSAADFEVVLDKTGLPVDLPAAGTRAGSVTVTMKNLTTNQDNCKGVQVPLYFTAS